MTSRIYSIVLIVAVLACPMACGLGIAPCCAQEKPDSTPDERQEVACKCHCASATQDPCEDETSRVDAVVRLPADVPGEHDLPCQGICGGAVVEKPSLPVFDLIFLTPIDQDVFEQPTISKRCDRSFDTDHRTGRQLRALHMSLLC